MNPRRLEADERGFSETFAVGALVALTLFMAASVGLYVLAVDVDEGPPEATFSYDYDGSADTLLVRYTEGQSFQSGSVLLEAGRTEATWAALTDSVPNATLEPGSAVQLSSNGRWGRPITDATQLRIHHVQDGNRTQLSNWSTNP